MSEYKTIMLGDFDNQTTELLSNIISLELEDEGINPQSFAFHIEVDYTEEKEMSDECRR